MNSAITRENKELFNISGWGCDYFDINEKGRITVRPNEETEPADVLEIIEELVDQDLQAPILLRFPDILKDRIAKISDCFRTAKKEYGYEGENYIVYPIKVNQMEPVVKEMVAKGEEHNLGLEAGSKPELHAVLASAEEHSPIICNGYKDDAFIELALLATKMGRSVILVVEKLVELRQIIAISKKIGIRPNIGIRIKLYSSGSGKWESSGGDKSKFGLSSSELLEAIEILEAENLKDCFRLIHFHLGSQITKIRMIKIALREAAQFYLYLKKKDFKLDYFDVGGGLGVDYDGTKSMRYGSINYSIQEYANDVVFNVADVCRKNNLEHPNIICESGRALTAHHTLLITEVLATVAKPLWQDGVDEVSDDDNELVHELYKIYKTLSKATALEAWNDVLQIREEAMDKFSLGLMNLESRAKTDKLYWTMIRKIWNLVQKFRHIPEEIYKARKLLTENYFCNFSVFQSLPDSWAIGQIFPVVPIQRLDEKTEVQAVIQDMTCDSDGKLDSFIGFDENEFSLPVHKLIAGQRYYLGVFLAGAYQEILGDLHNLFGDANTVHVSFDKNGPEISKIIEGETVSDVLGYMQYNSKKLVRKIESRVAAAVKSGRISPGEGKEFLSTYRAGLYGYTYLEH